MSNVTSDIAASTSMEELDLLASKCLLEHLDSLTKNAGTCEFQSSQQEYCGNSSGFVETEIHGQIRHQHMLPNKNLRNSVGIDGAKICSLVGIEIVVGRERMY